MALASGVTSPVSSTTDLPSFSRALKFQNFLQNDRKWNFTLESDFPIIHSLSDKSFHGSNVDHLGIGTIAKYFEHGQLSCNGFARSCKR